LERKQQIEDKKNQVNEQSTNLDENQILSLLENDQVMTLEELISKLNITNPDIIVETLVKLIENNQITVKDEGGTLYFTLAIN